MHPGLLVNPVLSLLFGIGAGLLMAKWITSARAARMLRRVAVTLCALLWLAYLAGIFYWRWEVEPTLDGTEGSGVGFGWVFIHVFPLVPALFLSGFAGGIGWKQRRQTKTQRDSPNC